MTEQIRAELFRLQDTQYRDFQIRLLPTVQPETVIGVRTPELRKLAKQLAKEPGIAAFLDSLPHRYFDENQLHAFVLSEWKDFDRCVKEVDRFLPFVDNWATCDQLSPRVFKKHKEALLEQIRIWLRSERTYTIRFAIGMLMQHYLDEAFDPVYLEEVSIIRSEEYYVNMMIAWYFATALAKQFDAAVFYLEHRRLDPWTHNKTIRKAAESYRISDAQKTYLKSLKIRTEKGSRE